MPSDMKLVTVHTLAQMKVRGDRIVALTAYDALFGALVDGAGVDIVLVGDSVNTVLCGQPSTLNATLDQMIYHGRAARAGVRRAMLVIDMPFMSYQVSVEDAKRNAGRVMQETGAQGIKLEGGAAIAPTVRALVDIGIPVMGHLGFTPQSVHAMGGARVQGRGAGQAERVIQDARTLAEAGVFALVLELVPTPLAALVTEAIAPPTIGIGSGPHCNGQVLVLPDMLGLNESFNPRFLKRYGQLGEAARQAIATFSQEVRDGEYPDADHSFAV